MPEPMAPVPGQTRIMQSSGPGQKQRPTHTPQPVLSYEPAPLPMPQPAEPEPVPFVPPMQQPIETYGNIAPKAGKLKGKKSKHRQEPSRDTVSTAPSLQVIPPVCVTLLVLAF